MGHAVPMDLNSLPTLPEPPPAPIRITPEAQDWLRTRLGPGQALRLGVKGGGCAGLTPILDTAAIEAARHEGLLLQPVPDTDILMAVEPEALDILDGATVDLELGGLGQKLVVRPAAGREGCGCGLSFRA